MKTKKATPKKPSSQTTVASRLAHTFNNSSVMTKIAKRNQKNAARVGKNVTRDIK